MKGRVLARAAAFFCGFAILALLPGAASAQSAGLVGPFQGFRSSDETPVEIRADRMKAELAKGTLVFSGHVTAKQGPRTIYAETMTVDYTREGKVTRLVAEGRVKVKMGDAFASSERLVLDNLAQVITLEGRPRVVQGRQILTGKKIIYKMEQEKIVVEAPRIEWTPEPEKKPESPEREPGKERGHEHPG